jgi:transcriptional regulator with XRE-family HTH domain
MELNPMPKIVPEVLKQLRTAKGWSQQDLAERAKIDKQTIFRLEHGGHAKTRERIIQQLARALKTDPAVLTGKSAPPDPADGDSRYFLMSKLNFRISTETHNALYLVSDRYGVTYRKIVELAPFLFCCVAEASLQQRRDRLKEAQRALEYARNAEGQMQHLPGSDFSSSEETFAKESESLSAQDLFGLWLHDSCYLDNENPFALFLNGLANATAGVAEFDGCDWDLPAEYRVCRKEAILLAGGDSDLADHILDGDVLLNEMPKEIRDVGKDKERTEWLRSKLEEYRHELLRHLGSSRAQEASQ